MINETLRTILRMHLPVVALFCSFATLGLAIAARMGSTIGNRRLYLALGGGLNFLSGLCVSTAMLLDNLVISALPVLLLFSLAWGMIGLFEVSESMQAIKRRRRIIDRYIGEKTGRSE